MAFIVALEAGEKGRLLLDLWARLGGHTTSTSAGDLSQATVVLFGGEDCSAFPASGGDLRAVIIDCSNAPDAETLRTQPSRASELARVCPNAPLVKAFNAISARALDFVLRHNAPEVGTVYTSAFYCGDDAEAKRLVAGLISELRLEPVDCGPLANAFLLESLGLLVDYLGDHVLTAPFALSVVGAESERSPLDRWM